MNALVLIAVLAIAAVPIYGEEASETKKHEKRGIVGLGYGGYSGSIGSHELGSYGGYGIHGGIGHGYVASAPAVYSLGSGLGHGLGGLSHEVSALPAIRHSYSAPLPVASYSHGYNSAPIVAAAPLRVGYSGLHGTGYGHGVGFVNGW